MKANAIRRPTVENEFVLRSMRNGIRLDGRQSYDFRSLSIVYGVDYGCCDVCLGDTRVLAQVSAEIVKPRETRPNEGELFVNVDLSPLASPAFEAGRLSEKGVEVNRLVERCLKESQPIDVESLCLVAGEKVWSIRVDVQAMNDSGNLIDCSVIAAVAGLANFRRPEVSVSGEDINIHTFEEKLGVPLNVHHMPISITFGFIGERCVIDPTDKEEAIIDGSMFMATNTLGEVCCAQMAGGVSLTFEQIMHCTQLSIIKSSEITQQIKNALEIDKKRRAPKKLERRPGLQTPAVPRLLSELTKEKPPSPVRNIYDVAMEEEKADDEYTVDDAEDLPYVPYKIGADSDDDEEEETVEYVPESINDKNVEEEYGVSDSEAESAYIPSSVKTTPVEEYQPADKQSITHVVEEYSIDDDDDDDEYIVGYIPKAISTAVDMENENESESTAQKFSMESELSINSEDVLPVSNIKSKKKKKKPKKPKGNVGPSLTAVEVTTGEDENDSSVSYNPSCIQPPTTNESTDTSKENSASTGLERLSGEADIKQSLDSTEDSLVPQLENGLVEEKENSEVKPKRKGKGKNKRGKGKVT